LGGGSGRADDFGLHVSLEINKVSQALQKAQPLVALVCLAGPWMQA
jgi:hypothetical protein